MKKLNAVSSFLSLFTSLYKFLYSVIFVFTILNTSVLFVVEVQIFGLFYIVICNANCFSLLQHSLIKKKERNIEAAKLFSPLHSLFLLI